MTEFVEEVILVLKQELLDGYLTEREFNDYVELFQMAADRVLAKHPQMREEVNHMTGPIIKLPSMIEDELREKLIVEYDTKYRAKYEAEYRAKYEAEYRAKYEAEYEGILEEKDIELAEQRAEIQRLQEENRRLMYVRKDDESL